MRLKLYQKVFVWFALNLLLFTMVAAGLVGFLLFKGSNGLLPPYIFSSNIENSFRAISANLQYKPVGQWASILRDYTEDSSHEYTIFSLDGDMNLGSVPSLPRAVLEAASRIPRMAFTLCPDPSVLALVGNMPFGIYEYYGYEDQLEGQQSGGLPPKDFENMEAGIPPQPRVIYMRTGEPARYWFGQAVFIPDEKEVLHYMLLAVSTRSFSGDGLFFDTALIGSILLLVIGVSCLWWWPFVRHISKPLLRMADVAECLASNECKIGGDNPPGTNICAVSPKRKDEIGRLAEAIDGMAVHISGILAGQRLFIHHVAHEINSPLARIKLGLAVLDDRLEGDSKARVQRIMAEMEFLSRTTDDIITFLRSHAADQMPILGRLDLCPLLMEVVEKEAGSRDVHVSVAPSLAVRGDQRYIMRTISNLLRNAIKYSPFDTLVTITAVAEDKWALLEIKDQGRGVPDEELKMMTEPFYRGETSQNKNGVGLGLYIAQYCVEACGGKLEFAKNEPTGLVVRIWLLLAEKEDSIV